MNACTYGMAHAARNAGATLTAVLFLAGMEVQAAPLRLAIYYGYPSLINGANGNLERAVAVFSDYDIVVLGDGLEFDPARPGQAAGHADHAFTKRIIQQLGLTPRRSQVYGYVDLGGTQHLPAAAVAERIELWARMGAAGVFLDEAGYDFGVSRERQNAAVAAAHRHGLSVCVNAFYPNDVLSEVATPLNRAGGGNPTGLAPVIGPGDAVLLESFAVREGIPEAVDRLAERTRAALDGRVRFGTRVFAVSTSADAAPRAAASPDRSADQRLADYAWWMGSLFGIDAFGGGMPAFSAITSLLPWVERPPAEAALAGAEYVSEPVFGDGRWRRGTTAGTIVVDPTTGRGALEPIGSPIAGRHDARPMANWNPSSQPAVPVHPGAPRGALRAETLNAEARTTWDR